MPRRRPPRPEGGLEQTYDTGMRGGPRTGKKYRPKKGSMGGKGYVPNNPVPPQGRTPQAWRAW